MTLPIEVITALIGVVSALGVVLIKDVVLKMHSDRRTRRRSLTLSRIEHAYAPLEFLMYELLRTDDEAQKEVFRKDIRTILRQYSHLLSEHTTSGLYTLLEDENTGAAMLQSHFFADFAALKDEYYRLWHTKRSQGSSRSLLCNTNDDKYIDGCNQAGGRNDNNTRYDCACACAADICR